MKKQPIKLSHLFKENSQICLYSLAFQCFLCPPATNYNFNAQ